MAEIEHFIDPEDKRHPKFKYVSDKVLPLYPRTEQTLEGKVVMMSIGEAVKDKVVDNETLGYFIARTYDFLISIGISKDNVRFR
jgi:glycyl-tRNA synthetase